MQAYQAAEDLIPNNPEAFFWHAVALANIDRLEEALPIFQKTFAMDENYRSLTPRLVVCGMLPEDQDLIERIISI